MRLIISFVLFLLLLPLVSAQPPSALPVAQDKFVGVWVFNSEKTKALNEDTGLVIGPNYYIQTITREGEYLSISIERGPIPKLAAERYNVPERYSSESQWSYMCDGKEHSTFYGSISCRFTEQNVIEGSNVSDRSNEVMFGKQKTYYWKREVSTDGLEMKSYSYKKKDMKNIWHTSVYDRKQ